MRLACILRVLILLNYSTICFSEIIYVPEQESSILSAVAIALNGDTILLADGQYNMASSIKLDNIFIHSTNGPKNCIIDFGGNAESINLDNAEIKGITITNSNTRAVKCYNNSKIINCILVGNGGGGIYCENNSSPIIQNCVIADNQAELGAGVYCDSAFPSLINCTITNNNATIGGGGIFRYESCFTCGLIPFTTCHPSRLEITNCILWNNAPNEISGTYDYTCCFPAMPNCQSEENVVLTSSDSDSITYSDIHGGFEGEGNMNFDPHFVDSDNQNYYLEPDSPCIDKGQIVMTTISDTDILGSPLYCGTSYDIGAYEYGFIESNPTDPPMVQVISNSTTVPIEITSIYNTNLNNTIITNFNINFKTYSSPVDIFLAYQCPEQPLLFLNSLEEWSTDPSAYLIEKLNCGNGNLSILTEVKDQSVQVYWLIMLSNQGQFDAIDWQDGAYELGWHNFYISLPDWTLFDGELKQVSVGADGSVWGVKEDSQILRRDVSSDSWVVVDGELNQISVGSAEQIWGVHETGMVFKWETDHWIQINGELKQVSVGADGSVWGVKEDSQILRRDVSSDSWVVVDGELNQISVGSAEQIWGVHETGMIFKTAAQR
ncbi:MAG: right-handed parallel beta-helix repeat-containing protein [Desulfamplus sp.]|nr:right-handed parallel beta-helix repeat-containing protein [Desulfamplus sp.]